MADRGRVDARDATGIGAGGGLVATGLTLRRDGRTVLQDASLTVPRGCVTALIAPSGAGKSTLLRCLNRLLDPDEGTVTIGGEDVRAIAPRALRRRVGLVAQHPVMLPGTVQANVGYGLDPVHRGSDRIAPALAAAGLPGDWADRIAHDLSGGEQARVAIARAIVLDPEFLLLDEPTSALDERSAALVGDTLRRLADRGIGVCLATHDLGFAETFADRTARLEAQA